MSQFNSLLNATEFVPSWLKSKQQQDNKTPERTTTISASPTSSATTASTTHHVDPTRSSPLSKLSATAISFTPKNSPNLNSSDGVSSAQPQFPVVHSPPPSGLVNWPSRGVSGRTANAVVAVNQKPTNEIMEISRKSNLRLTAATFMPTGYVPKAAKIKASPILPPKKADGPLMLRDSWSLYYVDRNVCNTQDFDPILVFRMDCVEDFWKVYNNIPSATNMLIGSNYYLFRQDVAPRWEDQRNRDGGLWQLRINSTEVERVDAVWDRLCCRVIGESWAPHHRDTVTGVVLKCREKFHIIQIWVSAKQEDQPQFPSDLMSAVEEAMPFFDIDYISHQIIKEHTANKEAKTPKGGRKDKKRK